jgi:5-formyltetrahydrofolate cyclo-ligase
MNSEIDLSAFNVKLASQNRLLLPRLTENELKYYQVTDLQALEKTQGALLEPVPTLCTPSTICHGDLILVPGLAFDSDGYRLGYGKGHFDRFLAKHPTIPTAGIGFLEQKSEEALPRMSGIFR